MNSYPRFAFMVVVSSVAMFGLMYLNTFELDHVFFSETRAYMALAKGAAMALIMLLFMTRILDDRRLNGLIVLASDATFAVSLWLVRSQATLDDVSYMKAMIPHHSIAIMTSTRARIHDPRVRRLADGIATTQVREIGEMNHLMQALKASH